MEHATSVGPSAGGSAGYRPAVEETHVSVLFLLGDRAFKLKKPIRLPFLDWRDREDRRAACHREVELNRRLAPDVYLGVADVLGPDGTPCDHLVVMRRMPDERRLSRLVREGVDLRPAMDELAALMASFHERATRSPATVAAAGREAVQRNWADNLAALHLYETRFVDPDDVARVELLAGRYLAGRERLFAERGRAGRAVDGHGDLLADDIYVCEDGPRVLDCLEFSDRLRAVDVLDDVAFLAMDLERLGAPELAADFLAAYAAHSREVHPDSLAHHYIAYRAGVRAKVACLRADQGLAAAADEARLLVRLARRHLETARVRLVLVGGLPGTGKSTLARALAERMRCAVLHSDVVRKRLAGVAPATSMRAPLHEGIYAPAHTAATYRALLEEAATLLALGESVVIDASWTDAAWRREAGAVAASTSSDLVTLRCVVPAAVAAARLVTRDPRDPSDATPEIAAAMMAGDGAAPWEGAIDVDTIGPPGAMVEVALHAIAGVAPPDPPVARGLALRSR